MVGEDALILEPEDILVGDPSFLLSWIIITVNYRVE